PDIAMHGGGGAGRLAGRRGDDAGGGRVGDSLDVAGQLNDRRLDLRDAASIEFGPMTTRVSTGLDRLDQMLGGGLLPGTLTVVYGATGIGKTRLGLVFTHRGLAEDGAPGVLFDMNARGDSQQHHAYAERLYGWTLGRWTHTVTPMAEPHPSDEQMKAFYCDALP